MPNNDQVLDRYLRRIDSCHTQDACRDRIHWMCARAVGRHVLDVGCSQGICSLILGREGFDVVGIDIEDRAIETARAALSSEPPIVQKRVRFLAADVYTAEFEPESFDTVIIGEVLEHVTTPAELLHRVAGWVKPGGRVIVSVPHGYHPYFDHKCSFYLTNLLDPLGEFFDVTDITVIDNVFLCAVAEKPRGEGRCPPTEETLRDWKRTCERALETAEREAYHTRMAERQKLRDRCAVLKRAAKEARSRQSELVTECRHTHDQLRAAQEELRITRNELSRARIMQVRLARSSLRDAGRPLGEVGPGYPCPAREGGGFLFFCVNGSGLGHLTRSLAVARRVRRLDPDAPLYFLTSSQALGIISREGMIAYHIPPRSEYGEQVGGNAWNRLLRQQIEVIIDLHHPAVLVYDGVSPYAGLIDAIEQVDFVYAAMILRLRHKHERLSKLVDRLAKFDELLLPGEPEVEVPTALASLKHRAFDPVLLLDREELLSRDEARRRWSIAPDKKAVYVQLGAGNINDIAPWIDRALELLAVRDDVEIVLAESPVTASMLGPRSGVHLLTHYPNSLYFNAFDLAITAAGYNTFHELMHFGVPSVLIPNQKTITDDQVARAATAEEAGAAKVVLDLDRLPSAIEQVLDESVATRMRKNAMALVPRNSALDVAEHILASAAARLGSAEYVTEREVPQI